MLRELGRACGSTALGLSMHTHLLALAVWRYQQGQPVAPLLRRVAAEQLVLVSTGASDWLDSSGTAEAVAGGYRVRARKVFASRSPAGDLLMTTARYLDPREGVRVLHFPLPMAAPGVTVSNTWQALGMRGSGSNDVPVEDVFAQHLLTGGTARPARRARRLPRLWRRGPQRPRAAHAGRPQSAAPAPASRPSSHRLEAAAMVPPSPSGDRSVWGRPRVIAVGGASLT